MIKSGVEKRGERAETLSRNPKLKSICVQGKKWVTWYWGATSHSMKLHDNITFSPLVAIPPPFFFLFYTNYTCFHFLFFLINTFSECPSVFLSPASFRIGTSAQDYMGMACYLLGPPHLHLFYSFNNLNKQLSQQVHIF